MQIKGSVAFVTGANRGLGLAYAKALLAAGASKVYAAVRDPSTVQLSGVIPVKLDVSNPADVANAVAQCGDVDLVINNAGTAVLAPLTAAQGPQELRALLEVNLHGVLAVSQAFAPILARNGGGAIVNMLSALSWITQPGTGPYSVSKAAAWALTNGLRIELRNQGTQVLGVHVGLIDTDMAAGFPASLARVSPEFVAATVLDAIQNGAEEVLVDDTAKAVKAGLNAEPPLYLTVGTTK